MTHERGAKSARDVHTDKEQKRVRKPRVATILIACGCILIVAALALVAYNWWDSERAQRDAAAVVQQLAAEVAEVSDGSSGASDTSASSGSSEDAMPTLTVDGTDYLGVLEVPSLGLELPVARTWNYDQLRISPCRYAGSYESDDLVICGHNYRSHFGPLLQVAVGADVWLVAVDGTRVHYLVGNVETVQPTAIEQMVDNGASSSTSGSTSWDLTLFTCNLGGQTRCAVRCLKQG